MVVLAVVSCQKHTYDFTYSPTSPKAGQTVSFSNQSDAGENWVWKFGDGSQSTLKNPSHIFTEAGTYVVEMMADSNKHRVTKHVLEVLDSIPSIYVTSDTVQQYTPVTLKVSLYNPKGLAVTYSWAVDEHIFVITEGTLTSDSLKGYYTEFGRTTDVQLTITVGDKTTTDTHKLTLIDNPAPTLLMQLTDGALYRQRLYADIYESIKPYDGAAADILAANDSTAVLNGVTYDIRNMPVLTDKPIHALQVDAVNRKLYLILVDGLYVANANGDALTRIVAGLTYTLLVNASQNNLYWSTDQGVFVMPLITNPNNTISEQTLAKIKRINELPNVKRMLIL